jgi:hypothetical protein
MLMVEKVLLAVVWLYLVAFKVAEAVVASLLLELAVAGAGGTGGNTNSSGSGFSSACPEYHTGDGANNGETLHYSVGTWSAVGGAYFESYSAYRSALGAPNATYGDGAIGGGGSSIGGSYQIDYAAAGGKGGTITLSNNGKIYAYNGAYITDTSVDFSDDPDDQKKQNYQSIIYGQLGYDISAIRSLGTVKKVTARTAAKLIQEWSSYTSCRTIDYSVFTTYGALGIGSGAGGTEVSNGTLTINN